MNSFRNDKINDKIMLCYKNSKSDFYHYISFACDNWGFGQLVSSLVFSLLCCSRQLILESLRLV